MLVLFENLGGVMSGARTRRAAIAMALGFVIATCAAPAADAIPVFACAVALGYIGYAIAKHATLALPIDPSSLTVSPLARQLVSVAIIATIVTQSVALTIFSLFAFYPIGAHMAGHRPKLGEVVTAIVCLVLVAMALR
jgi:xanthine/uracil/vitamin C permease (AzgA family)